jgi:predicted 3-demethylubiquinone-9 3-methyltransferase (glyoxalase superfamily)
MPIQPITPFLWFKSEAEPAARFYVSLFKNSKITTITRYGPAGPGPVGEVMVVDFTLNGQKFIALNGNTHFGPSPSISLFVTCKTQAEVNALWKKLLKKGSKPMAYGWITDPYAITWQIVPDGLLKLIAKPAGMKAMMGQIKLDINAVKRAVQAADRADAKATGAKPRSTPKSRKA